jgi:hypothetical protein
MQVTHTSHVTAQQMEVYMSQPPRGRVNRIALAVVGVLLVGGASGVWAATNGAPSLRQSASSTSNTGADLTNTPPGQGPVATATIDQTHPTNGSPTPTTNPPGAPTPISGTGSDQSVHWHTTVVSVGANSFVLSVGGVSYTILVNGTTIWSGAVKAIGSLRPGYDAEVIATRQSSVTYLASAVNTQPLVDN